MYANVPFWLGPKDGDVAPGPFHPGVTYFWWDYPFAEFGDDGTVRTHFYRCVQFPQARLLYEGSRHGKVNTLARTV